MNKQEVKRINQEIAERMKTLGVVPNCTPLTPISTETRKHVQIKDAQNSDYYQIVTDNETGTICHRKNGYLHRTDGPAIEWTDGSKAWYVEGKHHRTDGPAIEFANGHKMWYINGKQLTESEFNAKIAELKAQGKLPTKS